MKTVAVTPIIGEFGYIVFDIQPKVRAWLREQNAERRIVFASRELAPFFDEATELVEPPAELLPTAPATMRSIVYENWELGNPERVKIERLVEWAKATVEADVWFEIPYFQGTPWNAPAVYAPLRSELVPPEKPYVVVAARARDFDIWRNWPQDHWDELVARIRQDWKLDVRCIGRPPSTYFPSGAEPQEADALNRLDHSICLLNHAVCSVSSNSGPTHLSLMAQCPTFAWGEPYLEQFMECYTNPLGTPCCFYPGGWDPDVDRVWQALCLWRAELADEGRWNAGHERAAKLSMCMIVRDSSRTLEAALGSVKQWVDEMVVVDTGSTDETPTIADRMGAKVFHSPWQDSFSVARNESLRHARGEWVFWMDSDDVIDPENGRKLQELVRGSHRLSTMGYVVQVHCPPVVGATSYATATAVDHVKLFRNIPALRFSGRIHEQVLPSIRRLGGAIEWTDIYISHSGSDQSPAGRERKHARDLRLLELELIEEPDNTFTLFNIGMTLLDMGRHGDALLSLCRSLQLAEQGDSHLRKIYALLVQAYSDLKRPETALRTCIQGLRVCPGDPELLFRKGVLEQSLGQLKLAEQSFREVIARPADRHFSSVDVGILGVKAWHNLAVVYEQQQRRELAAEAWRRVLEFDHANPVAWRGLVDCCSEMSDGRHLEQLVHAEPVPEMPRALHSICRARLLARNGDPRAGVLSLKALLEEDAALDVLDEFCQLAFNHNLLDLAEWGLRKLARRRPDDPAVLQNLGAVYLRRHNYSKAAEAARRSLELRPNYRLAEELLATAVRSIDRAGAIHA